MPFPIITPELNLRPDGGGRLVLHALDLNATVGGGRYEPDGAYRREVLQRLRNVLRGGEHARIDKVSLGLRSLPADGHTVAGSDTSGHIYILATHSGVTLGPLLGRLAAQEILHDELAPELADYRPQRFQDATVFPPLAPARQPGEQ